MILVTFLLADHRPPFRKLWEGELPAVPDEGEPIGFDNRLYRVMERSWRFGSTPEQPGVTVMGCGVLLQQIGGAPHVLVSAAPPQVQ